MWRLLILPMLVLSLVTGGAARVWRGRSLLAWAAVSLGLQTAFAVLAVMFSATEATGAGNETWVLALAVLAPLAGAATAMGVLALLPRR